MHGFIFCTFLFIHYAPKMEIKGIKFFCLSVTLTKKILSTCFAFTANLDLTFDFQIDTSYLAFMRSTKETISNGIMVHDIVVLTMTLF